ncbi:MAG: alpha-amylase [Clostridia bacterium]|nr:alpha-amylase [Clostridia bacterium]
MAENTSVSLRNRLIYSAFVRQHTPEGTFRALMADLPRIRALGADILWLMPIYPIGEKARKGSVGSPYAIRDYRGIQPSLGTLEDLKALVHACHEAGMRVILDIVFNHTSPDSVLASAHPEWFYHKKDGSFGNRIGDWSDIIDLDYGQKGLWEEQIGTLLYWADIVDGFRCDVAPLVPLAFWKAAREAVAKVHPDCLWLAESVEPGFTLDNRARGLVSHSDGELYQAFDILYDYDVQGKLEDYLHGRGTLAAYADAVQAQEYLYPENFVKLRFLENHDRQRAAALVPDRRRLRNLTAFLYFQHGTTLLYAGQEFSCAHLPDLFEKDVIDRSGEDLTPYLVRLLPIRRLPILREGSYRVHAQGETVLQAMYRKGEEWLCGTFCVGEEVPERVQVPVPDGYYRDLVDGREIRVEGGEIALNGACVVVSSEGVWNT